VEESKRFGSRDINIYVTGNGFLYNMVRTMVGTIFAIADGKRTEKDVETAYQTGERSLLGKTMPAKGLTLMQVNYNEAE
jgi:tRNA pseudouridine38-40 synthase